MATSSKLGFISDAEMEQVAPTPKGFISDDQMMKFESESGPSVAQSAIRQFTQGASGGLSDELSGGLEAAGRVVGLKGVGGPIKDISAAEGGPTFSMDDLKQAYEYGRNQEREGLKQDVKKNPVTSLAAGITGGIVSPINKIAKGMSAAKAGATLGGVYGFGTSESDSALGMGVDTVKGAALGGLIGKGVDKIAKGIAPASENIAARTSPAVPKKNVDEIIQAADKLGIKVTPGMLDDSGFVERLESSLAKSPSIMGQSLARKLKTVNEQLSEAATKLTDEATTLSPYQVGEKFKSGVTAKVGEDLAPISQVFDEVAQSTKFIPISQRSKDAIVNNIKKIDAYALTEGAGKPQQYVNMIGRLENADQVKQAMTLLNADIRAAQGAEKQVLIGIKNKLSALEENSITRAAIQQAREGGMREATGKKIGSEIVNDLKDARTKYREMALNLQDLAENARIKTNKGPSAFLDAVESIPSERIQDKFFNVENIKTLNNLKEKFPEQFNLLKQGKLKEISDATIDKTVNGQGRASTQRFLNEVRKLGPEAKQLLFNDPSVIDDITKIQQSMPRNFNPSGTASEMGWQDALYRNVKDIPSYLLYKGASTNLGKKIGNNLNAGSVDTLRDVTASATSKLSAPAARLAAESAATKKLAGYAKWENDGAQKLQQHDSALSKDQIEQLKKTKKGRDLLIRASDLKPKSKAMDNLIGQIKEIEDN
ncbi:MAG: hypothetical protein KBE16_00480 [Alphaproteobacteria bacterium]|nr:hypothetical protein [Alphaproteobacteria bacterium]